MVPTTLSQMPRTRRSWPLWFATAALGALAACGGSSAPGGDDAPADAGTLPGFDAPPPQGLFPLRVSSDGATLTGDNGTPFLLHAEAAWSLIAQLDTAGAMQYLADRHKRGVTAVLVNLIEHLFADNAPANAAGDQPFTTPGDFSTHNEAYFAHADRVIDLAASQGIAVLLTPSYLGYSGGSEGWFQEMSALSAAKCRNYGDFVGQRYASRQNIIWVWGGDFTPPTGSAGETCMKAIRDGIMAAAPGALASAHWSPESNSLDETAFASSINLVGVYTYQFVLQNCRDARADLPRRPTYLIETCYEGETIQGCSGSAGEVRRRQWWGMLGCGAGEIAGNFKIWKFASGWPQQLGSKVSLAEQRLLATAQLMAWQTLDLDDALVADRGTGYSEIAAARTADGKHALVYVPPDGAATFTVDLGRMAGPVTAVWQDPTTDHSVAAGDGLTGSHGFTTPGDNSGGDGDWVLVLSSP
jgi:uncharacterized protein DUF4038/collagenase-like protein with putative collagen-binding domain